MKEYKAPGNLLENKTIIVTGAANGIGKATAISYAQHGATVILVDKDEKGLEQTFDEIEKNKFPESVMVPVDFLKSGPPQYEDIAKSIGNEFNHLDGIVHCAGWLGTLTPLQLFDDEVWSKVLTINLQAPYWLTRACLSLLLKSSSASVIFTTSDVGRQPRAYWGAYSVAAAGLENLAKTWSEELEDEKNIRINTLDPGPVRTKMRANSHPGEDPGQLPNPEDVTPMYLYLMGADSEQVRGQQLTINSD
jgi:NAD(P)-dependent dehydrogenase (short-subunit alcohol dehydrogenase family)